MILEIVLFIDSVFVINAINIPKKNLQLLFHRLFSENLFYKNLIINMLKSDLIYN